MALTKEQILKLLQDTWKGIISVENLPVILYNDTAKSLLKGVYDGYGGTLADFKAGTVEYETLLGLQTNIYEFSAAKTFQNVKDMSAFATDANGFRTSFQEFSEGARHTYDVYNKAWLSAESDTAIAQADSAARWNEIEAEKDDLPFLEFQTVGDARVRDDHAELDGIVKPINDPFWNTFMPPLGYRCRCIVLQLDDASERTLKASDRRVKEVLSIKKSNPKQFNKDYPKLFRNNPGKTKTIFDKNKHPYFKVSPQYKDLKNKNFGLKVPK